MALVALGAIAAGLWFFVLPNGSAEPEEPVAGAILALDPVAVNLAGGGYLEIGVALQLTTEAEVDGTKAKDLIISHFSQADAGEVHSAREALKEALVAKIVEAYEGAVMDVYYLEYVTPEAERRSLARDRTVRDAAPISASNLAAMCNAIPRARRGLSADPRG